ncbi:MAG: methylamine dehydrogenase accessory protein MauD [Delftia acidovorans]|uniref:methylamine dehydrogenase accessory protein MauD n=1 Tax=Delftia acidovorans TaxID=80866 RepID=UPI0028249D00|nr:methylamine dehydrogenase accessory protein MauD [Delftia acidovorans]MDR3017286.1 methylamine dehydrogenase accessory protein MauD [Delftia acidovorans]
MSEILPYVIGLHTVLLLVLGLMVFGLARQIGILHERVAPMGAMVNDHGPEVGEMAPEMSVASLHGGMVQIGGTAAAGRSRLLMFVSPTCPVCKKLLPIARAFAQGERLEVTLVGDGDADEQRRMIEQHGLADMAYVNSPQVGMAFQVGKLPYAVLIDAQGVIRAKGLVNSREHLESLAVAEETGYGSIQAYLKARELVRSRQAA